MNLNLDQLTQVPLILPLYHFKWGYCDFNVFVHGHNSFFFFFLNSIKTSENGEFIMWLDITKKEFCEKSLKKKFIKVITKDKYIY